MIIDNSEYIKFHFDCLSSKPKSLILSSFGLYAGITYSGQDTTEWGEQYQLATRDLIHAFEVVQDVKFLIGIQPYKSCKGTIPCKNCEKNYIMGMFRLLHHADKFNTIQWKVSTKAHLKCSLFFYEDQEPKGIAGSRNFSNSTWPELSFVLNQEQIYKLHDHVTKTWESESSILNDFTVEKILYENNISEKTVVEFLGQP